MGFYTQQQWQPFHKVNSKRFTVAYTFHASDVDKMHLVSLARKWYRLALELKEDGKNNNEDFGVAWAKAKLKIRKALVCHVWMCKYTRGNVTWNDGLNVHWTNRFQPTHARPTSHRRKLNIKRQLLHTQTHNVRRQRQPRKTIHGFCVDCLSSLNAWIMTQKDFIPLIYGPRSAFPTENRMLETM